MMMRGFSRKIGLAALSILLLLGSFILLPVTSTYAAMDGKYIYEDIDDDTVRLTGYTELSESHLVVPATIAGKRVVEIGDYSFWGSFTGNTLTIEEGVLRIGHQAFRKDNLTDLIIPSTVIDIGEGAFLGNKLTSITLPEHLTKISDNSFAGNRLTSIMIPSSVTEIEYEALSSNQLTQVIIPSNVNKIWSGAFSNNSIKDVLVLSRDVEYSLKLDYELYDQFAYNQAGLTIYGYEGSTTQTYATDKGHSFEAITAALADLAVDIPGLTFASGDDVYDLTTDSNSISVTATSRNPFAEVEINSTTFDNGTTSSPISLNEGANTITVDVTIPDGITEEQYILNILVDSIAPSIDLTANPTSSTNGNVTVTVDAVDAGSGVSELKWAAGNEGTAFFTTGGEIIGGYDFTVTSNGTYTVYARDNAGNEAVETITISNIVRSTSTPPTSPDPDDEEDSPEDSDPHTILSTGPGVIIIEVARRDIKELPKDNDGNKEVVNLPDDVWDEIPKLLDDDRPVIRVIIDDHLPDVEVHLPGKRLAEVLDVNPNVEFDLQLNGSSFQLKVTVLDLEQLATQLGIAADEMNVIIKISALTGETKEDFILAAEEQGMTLLSQVIEFQLIVSGSDEWVEITDFGGTYMTKSIVLDEQFANRNYMAVLYDPDGRTFTYVPAVMARGSNGQQDAVMQMPHNSIYAVVETDRIEFADMQGHWAEPEVEHLGSKRIVRGMTINDYAPNRNITRAEFASLLVRALGIKTDRTGAGGVFEDVATTSWYSTEVEAAFKAGLVSGISSTQFAPEAQITREQIAVMLMNARALVNDEFHATDQLPNSLTPFADASEVSAWAGDAMSEAIASKLIQGMSTDQLAPGASATRAQAAVMLHRLMVMIEFLD